MIANTPVTLFHYTDLLAIFVIFSAWIISGLIIENPPSRRPSVSVLMAAYRREWMVQYVTRQPRIFDAQIVANLRQGTAFFASASMVAIGGGLALIGNADMLRGVARDFTQTADPVIVLEIKIFVMLIFAANAFLKFVWSHRLFGYCSVLMAAVPNDPEDPVAYARSAKAGEINITAARGYNRGLRSVYFGIAMAAWLAGPYALMISAIFTLAIVLRREFASQSRAVLLDPTDGDVHTGN
ncbi:DUF599 domain-containing protein [Pseudoprimorskyibacter insulae]|uniref:DUF599 domain-containing protein n=1 Tax=Pseudoprimorskyibacter insulae TaxID=1695997 RepID=A0A2R8AYY2_9RHOB|nr:DUF599 domain-containing protein [Pseudoprimorskyibacter insulae]SPF81238.1 hypothetical protein PRI8871_03060 [Pseudoprimorskyibacter insulae]